MRLPSLPPLTWPRTEHSRRLALDAVQQKGEPATSHQRSRSDARNRRRIDDLGSPKSQAAPADSLPALRSAGGRYTIFVREMNAGRLQNDTSRPESPGRASALPGTEASNILLALTRSRRPVNHVKCDPPASAIDSYSRKITSASKMSSYRIRAARKHPTNGTRRS